MATQDSKLRQDASLVTGKNTYVSFFFNSNFSIIDLLKTTTPQQLHRYSNKYFLITPNQDLISRKLI